MRVLAFGVVPVSAFVGWQLGAANGLRGTVLGALAGFAFSALMWLVVAVATPAPMAVVDAALMGARHVHNRLPPEIRERLPEELRLKIGGQH